MSPRLPETDGAELVRALKQAGFIEQRQRGSHLHMVRVIGARRRVTIPIHKGRSLPAGTLRAILRDAELSVDQFLRLLKGH